MSPLLLEIFFNESAKLYKKSCIDFIKICNLDYDVFFKVLFIHMYAPVSRTLVLVLYYHIQLNYSIGNQNICSFQLLVILLTIACDTWGWAYFSRIILPSRIFITILLY